MIEIFWPFYLNEQQIEIANSTAQFPQSILTPFQSLNTLFFYEMYGSIMAHTCYTF